MEGWREALFFLMEVEVVVGRQGLGSGEVEREEETSVNVLMMIMVVVIIAVRGGERVLSFVQS